MEDHTFLGKKQKLFQINHYRRLRRRPPPSLDPPIPLVQKLTHRPSIGIPPPISPDRAFRQRPQATNDVTSGMRNFRKTNEEWAILLRAGCAC